MSQFKLSRQHARHLEREREKARKAGDYTLDKRLRDIFHNLGFSLQFPRKKAQWRRKTYPAIQKKAAAENGVIFF